jgi:hypothetical protein
MRNPIYNPLSPDAATAAPSSNPSNIRQTCSPISPLKVRGERVVKPAFVLSALVSGLLIGGIVMTASAGIPPAAATAAVANR